MSLFSELKERKVIRVAGIYLVVAWLIMQVVDVVSDPLLLPGWFGTAVLLLLVLGFPIALIFSWIFDTTPAANIGSGMGKPLAIGLIVATAVAVGLILRSLNSEDIEPESIAADTPEETQLDDSLLPNSVAVLLCDNLSPDPDDAFFAAGIHEEILNQLVKLSQLNVIARTSVLTYADSDMTIPEIANELKVESVLECSVRFSGTSIMVTAQLIDPQSNSHLWSETYPGDIGDLSGVFAMQADIAINIANALHAELSPVEQQLLYSEMTDSPEAYRLYLQARTNDGSGVNPVEPLALLDQAITHDPEFAEAYAYKATLIASSNLFDPDPASMQVARETVEFARNLDPDVGLATLAVMATANRDKPAAMKYLAAALEQPGNDARAHAGVASLYRYLEEYETAYRLLEKSLKLDPNSHYAWRQLALAELSTGRLEEALVTMQHAIALSPENNSARYNLVIIYLGMGRYADALDAENHRFEISGGYGPTEIKAQYAMMLSQAGADKDLVNDLVAQVREEEAEQADGSLALAAAHIALGELDEAYDEMQKAIASQWVREKPLGLQIVIRMKLNIWNHPALEEPRFAELRSQLGYQDD